MHIPTVCLLSSSLHHPVSLRHEPLRCCSQHHRIAQKKIHPSRTVRACLERRCPSTCTTHWPVMSTQRYFISLLPFGRRSVSVTFLVNRHERGKGGGGANSLFRCSFKKRYGFNNAEWQNHCCFCAVVVVSSAHEDQVKKCRDRRVNQSRNRQ